MLRRWKHPVESNGSVFRVVTLPNVPIEPFLTAVLSEEDIEVIDLYDCFARADASHPQRQWHPSSPYRFENDYHWNEAGNQLAAICLYRVLEEEMRLPVLTEDVLRAVLHRYYSAFGEEPPINVGGGNERHLSAGTADIREKYETFERSAPVRKKLRDVAAVPGKRITLADFDGYLDGRRLVYVKKECRPFDREAAFFLHVTPVEDGAPGGDRVHHGFNNLDFWKWGFTINESGCRIA